MAQLTKLDLNPNSTSTRNSPTPQKQSLNRKPTIALVGTVLATAFAGAFLLESSACSKNNKPVAAAKPETPAVQQAAVQPPPPPALPEKKPVRKNPRQSTRATYENADYGVSLVYPKGYTLKQGDDAAMEWAGLGPGQMNFSRPDGETIAAIELPRTSYPETDFASGFFNVSVHPKMAADECAQFSFPTTAGSDAAKPAPIKIGDMEFSTIEATAGDDSKQADAKYYHLAQNGSCYEFALGVQTSRDGDLDLAQVDRVKVFNRLKRILTTVKVKVLEEKPTQTDATASPVASPTAISQK